MLPMPLSHDCLPGLKHLTDGIAAAFRGLGSQEAILNEILVLLTTAMPACSGPNPTPLTVLTVKTVATHLANAEIELNTDSSWSLCLLVLVVIC